MNADDYKRQNVVEYVEGQAPDETVTHAEHVATKHLMGDHYDVWDVWTDSHRWWVIEPLTNLYSQDGFKSLEMAWVYHLGVERVLADRDREIPDNEKTRALDAWRKFAQAAEALDMAQEPEDFQAVGMRLREGLIAFIRALSNPEYVPAGVAIPKAADFIGWADSIADFVAPGPSLERLRTHLKAVAGSTWRLVQWLTHSSGANRDTVDIAVSASNHLASSYLTALLARERADSPKCPNCRSLRIATVFRSETIETLQICEVCNWTNTINRPT